METYIAALDQGTTSSRAILFNRAGEIVSRAQHPFRQIYPQPGWVEHDPLEIWATEKRALAEVVGAAHIDPKRIAAWASPTSGRPPSSGTAPPAAALQRHRMAVPPDRSPLRRAEGRGPGAPGGRSGRAC